MAAARPVDRNGKDLNREAEVNGTLLVLGADERLTGALSRLLDPTTIKAACCAADTEGRGTDVVLIASEHPFEELAQVRVHPYLFDAPVVLLAPGHAIAVEDWRPEDVWPVTAVGWDQVDELVDTVGRVLARTRHPSYRAARSVTAA